MALLSNLDSGDNVCVDDEDLYVGYRKPEVVDKFKLYDDSDDLDDYINFRLWLARQLALAKYYEKWGNLQT